VYTNFRCVYDIRKYGEDDVDAAVAGDTGLVHPFIPGSYMLPVHHG